MVLIFGEIIPSALFTGHGQMRMAAKFIPFTKVLMASFYIVSYPIARVLDYVFGVEEDSSVISRDEFEALVTLQRPQKRRSRRIEINASPNSNRRLEEFRSHKSVHAKSYNNTFYYGSVDDDDDDSNNNCTNNSSQETTALTIDDENTEKSSTKNLSNDEVQFTDSILNYFNYLFYLFILFSFCAILNILF